MALQAQEPKILIHWHWGWLGRIVEGWRALVLLEERWKGLVSVCENLARLQGWSRNGRGCRGQENGGFKKVGQGW